jgi:hypothetical protein
MRAQAAAVQITGLRPAIPQHACRCPQHIQHSAASCLSLNSPDLPIRGGCPMAQRDRRRVKPSPLRPISAETAQLDNAGVRLRRAERRAPGRSQRERVTGLATSPRSHRSSSVGLGAPDLTGRRSRGNPAARRDVEQGRRESPHRLPQTVLRPCFAQEP